MKRPIRAFEQLHKDDQAKCKKEIAPYIAQLGREKLLKNLERKRKLEKRIDEIIYGYIQRHNDSLKLNKEWGR